MLDLMTLYTTQWKQYDAGPAKAITWSVLNKSGSEMRNLSLSKSFITKDMSWLQTDDKDIKKTIQQAKCNWQYAGQELLIYTIEAAKIKMLKSYCYPIYGCALWRH